MAPERGSDVDSGGMLGSPDVSSSPFFVESM